jgi:hypothetical protein
MAIDWQGTLYVCSLYVPFKAAVPIEEKATNHAPKPHVYSTDCRGGAGLDRRTQPARSDFIVRDGSIRPFH